MATVHTNLYSNLGQLGAEELLFGPFSFGVNWTQIRIGIRYNIAAHTHPNYGNLTVPSAGIGVCAGKRGWTDSQRDLAILHWPRGLYTASLGIPGLTVRYCTTNSNDAYLSYRTAVTGQDLSYASPSQAFCPLTPRKAGWFMDILKAYDASATLLTVNCYTPTASVAGIGADLSDNGFAEILHNSGAISNYNTYSYTPTWSLTLDQINRLDHALVYWFRNTPVLNLYNVGIARFL